VLELLGAEVKGRPAVAGAPAVWDAQARAFLIEHIEARRPFIDHQCRRTDAQGRVQTLQFSGEPIFDSTSRYLGFRGVGTDVTDRVQREAARLRGPDA
jgi:PAS domain S-box-containing protein